MQLHMLVPTRKEPKQSSPEDGSLNRRLLGRIKAVQSEGKAPGKDRSQPGKEVRLNLNGKRSRRKRRPVTGGNGEESELGSQDRSSPLATSKQIRIAKDKYCLNSNLSRLIRKSINECSQGGDKTLKLQYRRGERAAQEDKKRVLEMFNDTIRKNNLRQTLSAKEAPPVLSHSSTHVPGMQQLGSYVKRMSKMVRPLKETGEDQATPLSGQQDRPLCHPRGLTPNESDRRRRQLVGQAPLLNSLNDSIEGKRSHTGPQKKTPAPEVCFKATGTVGMQQSPSGLEGRGEVRDRSRTRERSMDDRERRSSEDCKRKTKNRFTRALKKLKNTSQVESDKIKENLQKLSTKAKQAVRKRALSKRLTRQRRSKSSNDLFSDHLVKKAMGRSDSVHSKTNHEDNMYQEFRRLVARERRGDTSRDGGLKDRLLRRVPKEKGSLSRPLAGLKSAKIKTAKSSKIERRLDSFPLKNKRLLTSNAHPVPPPEGSPSDRERDLNECINQLSHKISKNYENIPSILNKAKSQHPLASVQGTLLTQGERRSTKRGRGRATQSHPRKLRTDEDEEDDIPHEEKELIEKEILQPKHLDSGYHSLDQGRRDSSTLLVPVSGGGHSPPTRQGGPPSDQAQQDLEDRLAEAELNGLVGSPHSVKIKDSDSSERDESERVGPAAKFQKGSQPSLPPSNGRQDRAGRADQQGRDSQSLLQGMAVKTPTGDPLSQEQYDKWMYLLQEFKKCENYGYVDGELKSMISNLYEKTQRGLTQLIAGSHGRHGLPTSSDSRLHPPLPTSQSEEESKRRKRPHLGIDVDQINEDYTDPRTNPPPPVVVRDTRSNSFQWLRAEFEQNLEELGKLLGNNKSETLKRIQDAMELNERYSDMFELRVTAINQRLEAQKEQILDIRGEEESPGRKEELLAQLDEWYTSEMEAIESERKKITKGWFTSIETIQKIKRDLEITNDTKKGLGTKAGPKNKADDGSIYNIISRSLASPSSRKKDHLFSMGRDRRFTGKEPSPMASPHGNSAYSHSKIISDPNLHSMKMKQADMLRKNEELAKSIEQLENSKARDRPLLDTYFQRPIEISEAKQNIINEIDEGFERREKKGERENRIHVHSKRKNDNLEEVNEKDPNKRRGGETPVGSPPLPSPDSSNLYNVSPTSLKRHSKPTSSNKPRSTLKSGDLVVEDKARPEDLIWIRDQTRQRNQEPVSLQASGPSISYPESASIQGPGGLLGESANSTQRYGINSQFLGGNLIAPQSPPTVGNHLKDSGAHISLKHPTDSSSGDIRDLGLGTHTAGTNYSLESMFKKDSERGPKLPPSDFMETAQGREGSRRGEKSRPVQLEGEDYLNDLIQGIGFDSQAIKNDFEDTNKRSYGMDDFASMSDSDREDSGQRAEMRADLVAKLNLISDEILDMIFTDTIPDIIQMLENENTEVEWEISANDNQQIYLQDGKDKMLLPSLPSNPIAQSARRGIRVNFNAVKEYMSLLVNFIKGSDLDTKRDIMAKINTPYGLSASEKLASFHEGFDEGEGMNTARTTQKLIVSFNTFVKLEEEIAISKENEDKFRQGMEHIHNKMLFDSFNEALDSLRPFGLKGSPFHWRPNAGRLHPVFHHPERLSELLDKAQERVLDWAMFVCGFIPDKDDSMLGDIAIEEDYLNQIKEDRLIKMLTCEAFETDERWLIYDDEEVEVQTEIAELIFDQLLEEAVYFLQSRVSDGAQANHT